MGTLMNLSSIPYYEICIDEKKADNISGRMYCGITPEGLVFKGVEELAFEMEKIMDQIKFPEATMDKRSFAKMQPPMRVPLNTILDDQKEMRKFNPHVNRGEKGTLIVQIKFRQHASWQGIAKWVEKEETYQIGSELELFEVMDSIASL